MPVDIKLSDAAAAAEDVNAYVARHADVNIAVARAEMSSR